MTILGTYDYDQVRAALDVTLSEAALPDQVIRGSLYQGAAEAEVLRRVPAADASDLHIRNAAVLLTAAYLAPALPRLTRRQIGVIHVDRQVPQWKDLAAALEARAAAELAVASGQTVLTNRPAVFSVAHGVRGRMVQEGLPSPPVPATGVIGGQYP